MERNCKNCLDKFDISAADQEFYARVDVPEPTHCYLCRMQRRLSYRNERHLYHRKCSLSGKQIISGFSIDKPFPVYDIDVWWSDKWDPLAYGRDYDPNRPFFEQFFELRDAVPRLALQQQQPMHNSQYCNCASRNKNCYLVFSTNSCEDCYYGSWVNLSRDCLDNLNIEGCELCYECVGCRDCYNLRYSRDSISCVDSFFLRDCIGCRNCFGCTSLASQSYCLFNEPVGKAAYEKFLASIDCGSRSQIAKLREEIEGALGVATVKEYHGASNENCSGDYLRNSRNCSTCFEIDSCEDLRYCMCLNGAKSSMDHSYWGNGSELMYECQACGFEVFNLRFCNLCWSGCRDLTYCDHCFSTRSSFGCVSLKRAEYCILNKQYSREQFERLQARIISDMKQRGEWGEFFPAAKSTFAYNESLAQEQLPMSRTEVEQKGWSWYSDEEEKRKGYIGPVVELPDSIDGATDDLCEKILRCSQTGRPYKIIEPELKFYRRNRIPLPVISPNARHAARLELRNPRILWDRKCHSCKQPIQTSFAPARPEKVYCEACYHAKILS